MNEDAMFRQRFTPFYSISILFSLLLLAPWTYAEDQKHGFGIGLGAGPSLFTQDVSEDQLLEGNLGTIVSANFLYNISEYFSLGAGIEWEHHWIDVLDITVIDADSFSFLALFELHFLQRRTFSPYFVFGGGYTINSVSPTDEAKEASLAVYGANYDAELDNAWAIKAGIGTDIFVSSNLAVNAEFGWKYNKAEARELLDGAVITQGDIDGSAINVLIGFRYYFPIVQQTTTEEAS